MKSHPKNNQLKNIIHWRTTVMSILLLPVIFTGVYIFTFHFSGNATPALIYKQALITTWCQIFIFALETAIIVLALVVYLSARVSLKRPPTTHPILPIHFSAWQWIGLLCLLLLLALMRVFITEFMEGMWGDDYWTNVFLNLPRLLSPLFVYFLWRRINRNYQEASIKTAKE